VAFADEPVTSDWCETEMVYQAQMRLRGISAASDLGTCPQQGGCDNPETRDAYTYDGRVKVIHLQFQILCTDDGGNCAATASDVSVQVDSLNSDFAPFGFRFDYDIRFVNSTRFRHLTSLADAELMKTTLAVDPVHRLNIYVTTNAFCLCSYAIYPWDLNALTAQGGIVMTRERFYPQTTAATTLTHEMGHCLGLWHTHRGVTEVAPCSDCYESVNAGNRDVTGDFCEDTDPTPSNASCGPPGGNDTCSSNPWGTTDYQNYMGYAPDPCLAEFTPEQIARMHCWTESDIASVMKASLRNNGRRFGGAPFGVHLAAWYQYPVRQWQWDFGDGGTASVQNPAHTFVRGGVYDVSCSVTSDSGDYTVTGLPSFYITSETLMVARIIADTSASVRVDVSVTNRVPLTHIVMPFTWAGPLDLTFDSVSTAGLRTSGLRIENGGLTMVDHEPSLWRTTLDMLPDSATPIVPGSGPIVSLYFHTPPAMIRGDNAIEFISYNGHDPVLRTIPGDYAPEIVNGSVTLVCCEGLTGNIDNDSTDAVDVSDLTVLISHLYIDLRPLACEGEANVDGDLEGRVDIADLTRLIDYLYVSFDPPAVCQ
jgi:hypothetical protein